MPYFSTKEYGHELGLSAVFRQHRAVHSHCSKLHGYALAVKITFACGKLDERNWVQDFGALKPVKQFLLDTFDHKVVLAEDDPYLPEMGMMVRLGVADVIILPAVGCEAFAKYIFDWTERWLNFEQGERTVNNRWVHSVEVKEHGANSAIYERG